MNEAAQRTVARRPQEAPPIAPMTPAATPEVATLDGRPVPPIPQGAMQDAAYARNWWRVVIDSDRTPYQCLLSDVAIWGPNEAKLRTGDLVEVVDERSTLFALLYLVEHAPAKRIRFAELI
jgi:hypothetical protein